MLVIHTQKEAKALGLKRYFSGVQCPKGHLAERYTSAGCVVCGKDLASKWKKLNPEKHTALNMKSYAKNPARAIKAASAWNKQHPALQNAIAAKRRSSQKSALPAWADLTAIKNIYADAKRLSLCVDHIIPLQSNIVCGLHCEENLQLLTKSENSSKGNRFTSDWE